MKEVKTPKKPLIYYYGIVVLVLVIFNLVVSPILMEHQVEETDYGTFMSMIEKKNIGKVEVEDNQIVFTDKNNDKIYKTGLMNDPNLTDRLYKCGAEFAKDIDRQTSPLLSFLVTGLLPLIIFIVLHLLLHMHIRFPDILSESCLHGFPELDLFLPRESVFLLQVPGQLQKGVFQV